VESDEDRAVKGRGQSSAQMNCFKKHQTSNNSKNREGKEDLEKIHLKKNRKRKDQKSKAGLAFVLKKPKKKRGHAQRGPKEEKNKDAVLLKLHKKGGNALQERGPGELRLLPPNATMIRKIKGVN